MEKYKVTGMSCAACSARVEKAVNAVDGVESCSVNLLTGTMNVEGSASSESIIASVTGAGYGASLYSSAATENSSSKKQEIEDTETPKLKKRLFSSLFFLVILMYFSMGHMMWNFPIPSYFSENHIALCLIQLILTGIVMIINQKFFISGFKALWKRSPNMDTLVALGSSAAFVYSTYALFEMTRFVNIGDHASAMKYMHEMYFESAAMILTLITVGKMLEAKAKGKTTNALKSLLDLKPKSAVLLVDGKETTILAENVKKGDIFILKPGDAVPVDGEIIEGHGGFDESALTGESIPVDKAEGDTVCAGVINKTGFLKCKALRVGEDTTLSQIIRMVNDASSEKAPVAKIADKVSGVFVPVVIVIAVISTVAWLIAGETVGYALARGISVLVISCPCALGLATPVAIMVGNGVGAKNGILFKTAVSLENTGKVKTVVLDKTGTITKGKPHITDIVPQDGTSKDRLLQYAYALESKSEHPLAFAVTEYAKKENTSLLEVSDFEIFAGGGLKALLNSKIIAGGNLSYIEKFCEVHSEIKEKASSLSDEGKTVLYFACDGVLLGIIAVADEIKEDSKNAIEALHKMRIKTVMLTGDNSRSAAYVGKAVGVDEIISEVLPDGKEKEISRLMQNNKVAMVGDGINDAVALARADIGIAIGSGTDVAIDSADVVLMNSSISDVAAAIKLSRKTLTNIKQNLFWAFFYNTVGIPLAAGVFINTLGWELNPMFGAAAMSLSSFCVVSNALRLNFVKLKDSTKNAPSKIIISEEKKMEITLKIEGMMCPHCEANVKKNLEAIDGVKEASPDHKEGICVVVLDKELDKSLLVNTVNNLGYKAE